MIARSDQDSMVLTWMKPRIRGGGAPRIVIARRDDVLSLLGKQSKPTCPNRTLSLTQTELNLKIHGPNTHAGANSQAFFNSCFKPNLLAAH